MTLVRQLEEAAAAVRARAGAAEPLVGVVLGSGLGPWAASLADRVEVPYAEIPHMPRVTVQGHAGNLFVGRTGDVTVACLQGRVHLYEGHSAERVVFGVRLLATLGCRGVLITNAAGGMHPSVKPGDLMLVKDHLNLTGHNPLVGLGDELGPRFIDMTHAYDPFFSALMREAADEVGVRLHEGIYAALLGPSYETPAEIEMLRSLDADAVGMSTVLEVIALRHLRVRVAALSCITNLAAGLSAKPLEHAEVEETARLTKETFGALVRSFVQRVGAALAAGPATAS
jgi:purine-nucleoside phosphorylase